MARYSSGGGSGYDGYEDDFEVDAGDDLDGELEVDLGQADDGESTAAAADAGAGGGEDTAASAVTPQRSLTAQTSSYRGQDDGDAEQEGAASTYDSPPVASGRPDEQDSAGPTPQAATSASPAVAPTSSSPLSPPAPPLPPLNQTVSPYLARNASYHSEASSAGGGLAPAARAPAVSHDPSPANAVSFAAHVPAAAAALPAGAGGVPPRPGTSRGPGTQSAAAAIHSRPATASSASRAQPPAPAGYSQQQPHQAQYAQAQQYAASADAAGAMPALSLALLQQATQSDAAVQQQQLAAAIRQSVDVLRASEQARQLQAAVETLTAQVLAAERSRAAAEQALVELTQRMQEQEKRLNESWEAKLLEKQREVQQLRTKVTQLESQGVKGRLTATSSTNPRGSVQGGGISPEEAAALRKELEQTEVLIRGYQQENEAATRRIKELEESLTAAQAHAAEEVLRSERAVLVARDDVGRRNAETANKLARVLALEKELEGVRDEARVRESELKAQLEKLREEKKSMEAKAGGVDLKVMADGDVLVKQLREEMETARRANQALVQELQAKLQWYAENQDMLNKNDSLMAEQRDVIQQLQARLAQYEGVGSKGPAATRAASAQARVRELEAQVDQLHKALRGKAPANSLAAVVAAARPSAEENALVAELREQVEELGRQLREKDEEHERQLRSHLQQLDRLKAQYSERAGRLEAATKNRGRAKELERQLEEQKAIFARRVRELEAKLRAAQEQGAAIPPTPLPGPPASVMQTPTKGLGAAAGHGQGHGGGGAGGGGHPPPAPSSVSAAARRDDLVPASHLRARELEVKKLTADLERKSKQVSELHLKLGEAEARILKLTADLRRSHNAAAMGASPLPSRARNEHLPFDDRPVGPGRDAGGRTQQRLFASESGGGADDRDDVRSDDAAGAAPRGGVGRAVSAELVEKLEERCGSLTVENGSLRSQVAALGRQLAALRLELEEARGTDGSGSSSQQQAAIADLRRKLDAAELALATVQRSATEAVEAKVAAAAEHQRAMLRLHDEVAYREGLKWQERMAVLEQELRSAQQRCEQAESELAVLRSRGAGSWSPEAAAFVAMERRLDEMAREMAQREAKWRAVLQDTQSLHGVQSDIERRKWEAALAAKEAEVQATRSELQSLLEEVAAVQALQSRAAAQKQQRLLASHQAATVGAGPGGAGGGQEAHN
ncbi:hypothetical protein HYH02_013137 [Chlamydomonas schloesseri]|uniref:Centrosomal protein of 162 kDa n=1 Tax=Chlamydomonas schloesseri TaxID=2026947 RepID=A0A835SRN4_9CHLO|nr:hypothetical protein HYH02_013137 [Chlamydomonas schloesseri]|eukprot:KAG2431918.1 hypothetical protein HYH02_013137 [Chlamydomonas schloesseri]